MKVNTFNLLFVILAICPILIFFVDIEVFHEKFESILDYMSGLFYITVLAIIFVTDQTLITTNQGKKVNTLPLIMIIFIIECILLFVLDTNFFNMYWDLILKYLIGAIFIFMFFAVLIGDYNLINSGSSQE